MPPLIKPLVLVDSLRKKPWQSISFQLGLMLQPENRNPSILWFMLSLLLEVPLQLAASPPLRKLPVSYH